MLDKKAHLSDEELLLFSDQELAKQDANRVRKHVARCEPCRTRLASFENASSEFLHFHEQNIRARSFQSSHARDLLKARLAEASKQISRSQRFTFFSGRPLVSACLSLLLVAGIVWTAGDFFRAQFTVRFLQAKVLPLRTLTPGSAHAVKVAELCSSKDVDNDPPVDSSLEQAVFREYGIAVSSQKEYQLDYLITPALGGVESLQNIWPQPYSSAWNSRVKDQLENHLHALVCHGDVQLTTAQNDIASDWIAAYKKYFNTDKPALSMPDSANVDSMRSSRPNYQSHSSSRILSFNDVAMFVSTRRRDQTAMLQRVKY